jgi:hypothetical protein
LLVSLGADVLDGGPVPLDLAVQQLAQVQVVVELEIRDLAFPENLFPVGRALLVLHYLDSQVVYQPAYLLVVLDVHFHLFCDLEVFAVLELFEVLY